MLNSLTIFFLNIQSEIESKIFFAESHPAPTMVVRTYEDEQEFLEKINDHCWRIKKGFQPNMNVEVATGNIHTRRIIPCIRAASTLMPRWRS